MRIIHSEGFFLCSQTLWTLRNRKELNSVESLELQKHEKICFQNIGFLLHFIHVHLSNRLLFSGLTCFNSAALGCCVKVVQICSGCSTGRIVISVGHAYFHKR